MRKIEWDNPNKMHFESLHKGFNRQCRLIATGNQIGDVVVSFYIRGHDETECNGRTFERGHLQDYDINNFANLTPQLLGELKQLTRKDGGIFYVFRHRTNGKGIVDGAVLTTTGHVMVKKWYVNRDRKAMDAVDRAAEYVAE